MGVMNLHFSSCANDGEGEGDKGSEEIELMLIERLKSLNLKQERDHACSSSNTL